EALAIAEAELIADNLAAKRDLKELEVAVQRDIKELETALRHDIKELEVALRRDIKELETKIEQIRAALKRDIEELRADLKRDIEELRTDLKRDIKELETRVFREMKDLEYRMTIKLGTLLVVAVGAMATWQNAFAVHVAGLNTEPCFAEQCDWRLPNIKELHSIVKYQMSSPAVSDEFNTNCMPGVNVLTGSCTVGAHYWSSTTNESSTPATGAWIVVFGSGSVDARFKSNEFHARAVRGGSP
ncbi:MAG: DUF1566 domain-containing protein, partial [bacterium]